MIVRSKEDKSKLKALLDDDRYAVIMSALGAYVQRIQDEPITGNSEFETLRCLHKRDGGVEHLKSFFNELETDIWA